MSAELSGAKQPHILQVGYYASLVTTRSLMLEKSGYRVTSVLGNDKVMLFSPEQLAAFDLVVVGFSSTHSNRLAAIRWLKQNSPQLRVVVQQANSSERFPEADVTTQPETPDLWLETVARCLKGG